MENMPYLSSVDKLAPEAGLLNIALTLRETEKRRTKAVYINSGNVDQGDLEFNKATELIERANIDGDTHGKTVCIVENISPAFIEELGSKWNLAPEFFAQHASNPENHWTAFWGPQIYKTGRIVSYGQPEPEPKPKDEVVQPKCSSPKPYDFIDGNFEYPGIEYGNGQIPLSYEPNYIQRYCKWTPWYGTTTLYSNTRISYYQVSGHLYLFLVDAPLRLQDLYKGKPRRKRPTLKLPYARNWGGVFLPQLLKRILKKNYDGPEAPYSILESLNQVFRFKWQREILFHYYDPKGPKAFPPGPLCYMFSNSLWQENLRYLTHQITHISSTELRDPKFEINDTLHDLRDDVVTFLNTRLDETMLFVPDTIRKFWEELQVESRISQDGIGNTPVTRLEKTLQKGKDLERFLMDTFQLLISSVNVQDARQSNKLAVQVAVLSILASIFIPLSFITGFFGMNFKELNDSVLPISHFWAVSGGVLLAFAPILIFLVISGLDIKKRIKAAGETTNVAEKNNSRTWRNLISYC